MLNGSPIGILFADFAVKLMSPRWGPVYLGVLYPNNLNIQYVNE